MANAITWSVIRKNTAASADIANTSPVVISVSRRVGHVTLAGADDPTLGHVVFPNTTNGQHPTGTPPSLILDRPAAPGGLAGAEGLEPPTSGFGDRRSSQLSYAPARPRPGRGERGRL